MLGWYAGMEGGHALADLLLGREDFTGRLPYAIAAHPDHLPYFDADAHEITYDRWYGQRKLAHDGVDALYPLGFGLSYTTFAIDGLSVLGRDDEALRVSVTASNTGGQPGRANVQLYGTRADGDRAGERELLGFVLVDLEPGATTTVEATASLRPLSRWDRTTRTSTVPAGPVVVEAAQFWGDPAAASAPTTL